MPASPYGGAVIEMLTLAGRFQSRLPDRDGGEKMPGAGGAFVGKIYMSFLCVVFVFVANCPIA